MKNMFSGNREKQVPKTFKDCYKTDNVTNNLWLWAERLETIGIVLAVIIGIATLITFIAIAIYEYSLILVGIIAAPIAAFLEYITFHIIALLVGSLASIVQHTKISANVNLYKYALENNEPFDEPIEQPLKNKQTSKKKFACSQCGNSVEIGQIKCQHCGRELDWSNVL